MRRLAAHVGIADVLAMGPRSADDLAAVTNSYPDALYRTLRAMAARGIFVESAGRRFALTALSQFQRADHPGIWQGFFPETAIWAGGYAEQFENRCCA
jgi:C-methyltransferase